EVFPPDGAPPTRARYTNVFAKKGGQWLLASVRDEPFVPPSNYPHLRGLEWAVGEWAGEAQEGGTERLAGSSGADEKFLVGPCATDVKDVPVAAAMQWIGWDPQEKRVRSWLFDAAGGFGEGSWTHDGKQWTLKVNAVRQDGKKASATYVLTPVDADT